MTINKPDDQGNQDSLQLSAQKDNMSDMLKNLTEKDFLGLGVHNIAYIRRINVEGKKSYSIHAADGTPLSVMEDESSALSVIYQNDMEAITVH